VTISAQQKLFLSEILEDRPIPESTLIYFRERFRDKLHSAILEAFLIRSQQKNLKRQDLAARIHRTKAQISRWFSAPSNITLDSISDLMVGLGMDFDAFPFSPIENTLAPKEAQVKKEKTDQLFSEILANLVPGLARKSNEMDVLFKTFDSWWSSEASSAQKSGAVYDLLETMQPKPEGASHPLKYRQEALGQTRNNLSQLGEANA